MPIRVSGMKSSLDKKIPLDAERILKIPLNVKVMEYFVAWNLTFTVRSAYYCEWNHQFGLKLRRGDGQGASTTNRMGHSLEIEGA